jgi:hypothetical protein
VQWTGSDVGAGIENYSVFVSDNGGLFSAFQTDTTAVSALFTGEVGHTYVFYSIARDLVGNVEAAKTLGEATTTVTISDTTPPLITPSRAPAPNDAGWNNSAVTVSFGCSDSGSGLAPGSPPAPTVVSTQGAGQSVTATCTDLAGNSASATVSNINIDLAPPTLTVPGPLVLNATSPNGATASYAVSVSDTLDPAPGRSCSVPSGSVFPIGNTTVNCLATDRAGNASSGSFSVYVKGSAEQLNDLWLAVINDSRLPPNVKTALAARIQESLANFDPSNPRERKLACASMSVFITVVRAHSGRTIPPARADQLIADAIRIRAVLGC